MTTDKTGIRNILADARLATYTGTSLRDIVPQLCGVIEGLLANAPVITDETAMPLTRSILSAAPSESVMDAARRVVAERDNARNALGDAQAVGAEDKRQLELERIDLLDARARLRETRKTIDDAHKALDELGVDSTLGGLFQRIRTMSKPAVATKAQTLDDAIASLVTLSDIPAHKAVALEKRIRWALDPESSPGRGNYRQILGALGCESTTQACLRVMHELDAAKDDLETERENVRRAKLGGITTEAANELVAERDRARARYDLLVDDLETERAKRNDAERRTKRVEALLECSRRVPRTLPRDVTVRHTQYPPLAVIEVNGAPVFEIMSATPLAVRNVAQ